MSVGVYGKYAIITLPWDFPILLDLMWLTALCSTCLPDVKINHAKCAS